jgi:hypothetical protein
MVLGNILKVKDRSLIIKNLNNTSDLNKNILRGLSGCPIVINRSGTITKYSSSREYNARLLRQAEKQIEFYSLCSSSIKCPKVIGINDRGDIVSFEMDCISGINYIDFLEHASPKYIDFFIDSILSYIRNLSGNEPAQYSIDEFSRLCTDKIISLSAFAEYSDFFLYLQERIKNIDYQGISKTFCHGDLTLSNILFATDSFFFLDFLDSYIETWVMDLIKLKQDLFYLWGISRESENVDLRSVQISFYMWERIMKDYHWIVTSEEFKILESINFLRILPYAKEQKDRLLLDSIIKKTPLYEEFNNTNGREIV